MLLGSAALALALVPLPWLLVAAGLRARPDLGAEAACALARLAASTSLIGALLAAVVLALHGPDTSPVIGIAELGVSFRLDVLSTALALLIGIVGLVVVRFSVNYLDGDPELRRFMALLCTALGTVALLVTAGGMAQLVFAWIATSLALHGLLVFRDARPRAHLAARKKFVCARIGDSCLLIAAILLAQAFGTLDLVTLGTEASAAAAAGALPAGAAVAGVLVAVAALLKSAQFPLHGWLLEVMETPTPVSALLHAGIVNAGGFLVLRFADLVVAGAAALPLLAVVGAITAVVGALAAVAQTSVKVTLAWSTVGQMGFMLLQCGLGAFSSAFLHLIAHSIYKAHAFLQSGRALELASRTPRSAAAAAPAWLVLISLALVLAAYGGLAVETGAVELIGAPALVLGLVPVLGLWLAWIGGERRARDAAALLTTAAILLPLYGALQWFAARLTAPVLPDVVARPAVATTLLAAVVVALVLAALLQALGSRGGARLAALRVHLANGLYANDVFDRLLGAHRLPRSARS